MKRYLVGVYVPSFCDQDYLRDRDETIQAESPEDARAEFIKLKGGWLRAEERKLIQVKEL